MIINFHQFHMVSNSPWPLLVSLQIWNIVMQTLSSITINTNNIIITTTWVISAIISTLWWNNTVQESNLEGLHQNIVTNGLNIGIILFILSEVIFFSSFFWAYFHSSISPSVEIGQQWPPNIVNSFNPLNVPMLNTLILISSGASITWAHHLLLSNNESNATNLTLITCVIGAYFSGLQYIEYSQAEFTINDSSYGSIFFIGTGFHGIHVLIGTIFIAISLNIMNNIGTSKNHHISFEIAAWYWHFVDVVWLFLYLSIYWWGK